MKKLLQCNITPKHINNIETLVEKKETNPEQKIKLTVLQQMEYEDEVAEWLEKNEVTDKEMAETFAEFGFSIDELENLRNDLGQEAFVLVLPWLENELSSYKISKDLADASKYISLLVDSIKSHVNMDRANDLQPTNIHRDIDNTLTLNGFKLREKNIEVKKKFCDDMPAVPAYVAELNQIWTNLIDKRHLCP